MGHTVLPVSFAPSGLLCVEIEIPSCYKCYSSKVSCCHDATIAKYHIKYYSFWFPKAMFLEPQVILSFYKRFENFCPKVDICTTYVYSFTSFVTSSPRTHVCVFSFSISVCCRLAHWLQWQACESADVYRNRRRPLLEATCLLPGASDHREDCSNGQPRNPAFQHQSSWNPSASWKWHVSQVHGGSKSCIIGLHGLTSLEKGLTKEK